jgi:uncharacterized protein (UPF0332 family)
MVGSIKDLSEYRLKQAEEMLEAAKCNFQIEQYKTALNRAYYAVFHSIRAVNILDGSDSSKHSGVIAYFNHNYLKTEKLDKSLSKIIKSTYYLREKSDYDDFYIASKGEVETQLENAEIFLNEIKKYLEK